MNRSQKEDLVSALRERLSHATSVVVTRQSGLTVSEISLLRRQLRDVGVDFKVLKNTLTRIAVRGTMLQPLETMLEGPTALAISQDDPINAAKITSKFAQGNPKLQIVGGYLDGRVLDETAVQTLAKLPSLDELRSKVIAIINTPATRLAVLAKEPGALLARVTAARGRGE